MSENIKDQISQAIETYNKYAKAYIAYTKNRLLQFELNDFIAHIPKGAKILDVGCGSCRDIDYFKEEGIEVTGIDTSEEIIAQAQKEGHEIKKMDARKLTFKKETFDAIWCMATLADIPKEDNKKVIEQFHKVLKEKGILFIATKEGQGEKIEQKAQYENAPRFYAYYTKQEAEELLTKNKFTILKSTIVKDERNKWVEILAQKV